MAARRQRRDDANREAEWRRSVQALDPELLVHMLDITHSMALGITQEQTDRFLVAGSEDRWLAELNEILQAAVRKCDELRTLQRPRPEADAWLRRQLEGLGKDGGA
jgi:hypothetical protein